MISQTIDSEKNLVHGKWPEPRSGNRTWYWLQLGIVDRRFSGGSVGNVILTFHDCRFCTWLCRRSWTRTRFSNSTTTMAATKNHKKWRRSSASSRRCTTSWVSSCPTKRSSINCSRTCSSSQTLRSSTSSWSGALGATSTAGPKERRSGAIWTRWRPGPCRWDFKRSRASTYRNCPPLRICWLRRKSNSFRFVEFPSHLFPIFWRKREGGERRPEVKPHLRVDQSWSLFGESADRYISIAGAWILVTNCNVYISQSFHAIMFTNSSWKFSTIPITREKTHSLRLSPSPPPRKNERKWWSRRQPNKIGFHYIHTETYSRKGHTVNFVCKWLNGAFHPWK